MGQDFETVRPVDLMVFPDEGVYGIRYVDMEERVVVAFEFDAGFQHLCEHRARLLLRPTFEALFHPAVQVALLRKAALMGLGADEGRDRLRELNAGVSSPSADRAGPLATVRGAIASALPPHARPASV